MFRVIIFKLRFEEGPDLDKELEVALLLHLTSGAPGAAPSLHC